MNRKKNTCNRFRVLGNVGMLAGFLVLCVALEVGIMLEKSGGGGLAAAQTAGGEAAGEEAAGEEAAAGEAAAENSLLHPLNRLLSCAGGVLLAGGFLCKLILWRCPGCGCHLMLCARGGGRACPCCGAALEDFGAEAGQ